MTEVPAQIHAVANVPGVILPHSRFVAAEPACRAEDGIYFADGRVVILEVEGGAVHVHETTSLSALCDDAPEDWIGLESAARVVAGEHVITAGGTYWEAEGWVALHAAGDDALIWLVKLEGVDPVTEVRREGDTVVARSEAYPFTVEWRIPIADPERLTVDRRRVDHPAQVRVAV